MASQGASLQNYNNELVKCEIRPRSQGACCVSEGAETVLAAGGEEEELRRLDIRGRGLGSLCRGSAALAAARCPLAAHPWNFPRHDVAGSLGGVSLALFPRSILGGPRL